MGPQADRLFRNLFSAAPVLSDLYINFMGKQVFIAEKPSVARQFADALDMNFRKGDGCLVAGDTIVTWCVGHLITMCYPDAYDEKYKKWSMDTIPFIPDTYKYEVIESSKKQFGIVKRILTDKDVDTIYICTDSGREGEYIYRLVAQEAKVKGKRQLRVWIDSQTKEEILRGIRDAKDDSEYDSLGSAAYLRAKEDYLMGINFSRALTLRYGYTLRTFLNADRCVIAVGRVMTCVLGMVVRREREIRSFVKTPFYRVSVNLSVPEPALPGSSRLPSAGKAVFRADWHLSESSVFANPTKLYRDTGFLREEDARVLIEYLKTGRKETQESPEDAANGPGFDGVTGSGGAAGSAGRADAAGDGTVEISPLPDGALQDAAGIPKVDSVTRKKENRRPPLLYNLAELQNDCSRFFKISPDETLNAAQELYEKKLTTYPRTDARVLSSAVAKEITKNLNGLFRLPMYRGYIREIAEMGTAQRIGKTRYTDDKAITDHYAIIPTGEGLSALNSCSRTVANVYELIVRRFLSIFYPPAVFDKISMQVRIRTELFSASVKTCTDEGYQKVLDYSFFRKKESGGPDGGEQSSRAEDAGTLKDDKNRPSSDPSGDGGEEEESIDVSLSKVFEGLKKGAVLRTEKYLIRPGETKPPARYNSGSMILAMENAGQLIEDEELREQIRGNGIGTSATRAEILKKLETNRYIYLAKKTQIIQPTQLGEMIFDTVSCSLKPLLEPKLTASWEKGLAGVAEGSVSEDEYMTKLKDFVIRRTDHVKETDYRRELEQQFRYISRFYPEKSRASSWNQNFRSSGRTHTRARKEKNGN